VFGLGGWRAVCPEVKDKFSNKESSFTSCVKVKDEGIAEILYAKNYLKKGLMLITKNKALQSLQTY